MELGSSAASAMLVSWRAAVSSVDERSFAFDSACERSSSWLVRSTAPALSLASLTTEPTSVLTVSLTSAAAEVASPATSDAAPFAASAGLVLVLVLVLVLPVVVPVVLMAPSLTPSAGT